jgi:hypothetical protein
VGRGVSSGSELSLKLGEVGGLRGGLCVTESARVDIVAVVLRSGKGGRCWSGRDQLVGGGY